MHVGAYINIATCMFQSLCKFMKFSCYMHQILVLIKMEAMNVIFSTRRTGRWPVRAWFLRIASVRECLYARVCVCVSAPEAINN